MKKKPPTTGYRALRKRVLLDFEIDYVGRMLAAANGNVSLAARWSWIDRKHFWRLMQRTGFGAKAKGKSRS